MNKNFERLALIAESNKLSELTEKYGDILGAISSDSMKRYAILGESNSGKSLILNHIVGRNAVPVSLISGKHDKKVYVDNQKYGCIMAELSTDTYCGENFDYSQSSLWNIDAVVYIISALNPLTSTDIKAINACLALGIPCTLLLNKISMIDEEEIDQTVSVLKNQLMTLFHSNELVIFTKENAQTCAEDLMRLLENSEDSKDIKENTAVFMFAQELQKKVGQRYSEIKQQYESAISPDKGSYDDELFWEQLSVELEKRKIALRTKINTQAYSLYTDCIKNLNAKMQANGNPELWWRTYLPKEMKHENERIAKELGIKAEQTIADDRTWLSDSISKKYSISLDAEDINKNIPPFESMPGNINSQLDSQNSKKKVAITAAATSAAILAGGAILPIPTIATIITCSVAGVAALGTGFWAYYESQNVEEEKKSIVCRELDKYVSQCRDTAIENTESYINYCYDSLVIASRDAQLLKTSESLKPSKEQLALLEKMTNLSKDKKALDDIMGQFIDQE